MWIATSDNLKQHLGVQHPRSWVGDGPERAAWPTFIGLKDGANAASEAHLNWSSGSASFLLETVWVSGARRVSGR
jgi:hypothetical protein